MDRFQAMQVFARVVETGSFTRAADSLALPKGSVTKIVQQLEAHLKVRLLNRTTRQVTVTADGAAYYERTARLLNDLSDIEASLSNAQASPSGKLRVDMPTSVGRLVIVPALADFYRRYPDIQLDLGVSDRIVDLISDNVDCVIRGGDLVDQSLVARRVGNIQLVCVAAPAYVAAHGLPTTPRELETAHTMVTYFSNRTGRAYPFAFERDGEVVEFPVRYKVALNESNAHMEAVLAGLGISQVAEFAAAPHLSSGKLVPVLPQWRCPTVPLHIVYPPNRHVSAKVRAFVEWVAELFANTPHVQKDATPGRPPLPLPSAA